MTQVQVAACNMTRRQKFWGSAHEGCNQDYSSLNSFVSPEARSALRWPAQAIRSRRRAVTAKGVWSSHCPISTFPQSTRTSAFQCCIQQSGVKCQWCLKLLIQIKTSPEKGNPSGQEPFLLCICTVLTTVDICFTAGLAQFLKHTCSNYWDCS